MIDNALELEPFLRLVLDKLELAENFGVETRCVLIANNNKSCCNYNMSEAYYPNIESGPDMLGFDNSGDEPETMSTGEKRPTTPYLQSPVLEGTTEWQSQAACGPHRLSKRPREFYQAFDGEGGPVAEAWAKKICQGCAVIQDCLLYALENKKNITGIWGGMNVRERTAMRNSKITSLSRGILKR